MPSHHRTHASPASGSWWVSSLTARAASAKAFASPRYAKATAAVRISEPLPAVVPVCSCSFAATSRIAAPRPGTARPRTAANTLRVCIPTSVAPPSCQRTKLSAIWSSADASRRSAPVAATSAMHTAICVSSLYSPGAYGPSPPPDMRGCCPSGGRAPNSYGTPRASPQAVPRSTPAARSPCTALNVGDDIAIPSRHRLIASVSPVLVTSVTHNGRLRGLTGAATWGSFAYWPAGGLGLGTLLKRARTG